jgi:hypothetical protein
MSFTRVAFAVSLVALAAVSVTGKAHLPADAATATLSAEATAKARAALAADGWVPVGRFSLTADDMVRVTAFGSPRCDGAVLVTALPPSGEAAPLVRRLGGADGLLLYLVGDGLTPVPPGPDAYVLAKLAPLLARLGVPSAWLGATVPVAVAMLGTCADSALLPWDPAPTLAQPAAPHAPAPLPVPSAPAGMPDPAGIPTPFIITEAATADAHAYSVR